MATALIGGLIARGVPATSIRVVDPFEEAQARLRRDLGCMPQARRMRPSAPAMCSCWRSKPQQFRDAAASLLPYLGDNLIVSVAAGIRLADMQRWFGGRTQPGARHAEHAGAGRHGHDRPGRRARPGAARPRDCRRAG
ncbi:pyrroline-5-carboxylate reductase family protein [Cupriavidus basilensis]